MEDPGDHGGRRRRRIQATTEERGEGRGEGLGRGER
jgi:hypothetical protein